MVQTPLRPHHTADFDSCCVALNLGQWADYAVHNTPTTVLPQSEVDIAGLHTLQAHLKHVVRLADRTRLAQRKLRTR